MDPVLTKFLAVWGAVLGSASFGWNIWTWSRNKPRIAVVAVYGDFPEFFIRIELRNRGTRSTTVEEVMLVKYLAGWPGLLGVREHFENASAKYRRRVRLPAPLAPGEVWMAYIPVRENSHSTELDKKELLLEGKLFFQVKCAHTDRLVSGRIRPEQ